MTPWAAYWAEQTRKQMENIPPRRRIEVVIRVSADDWEEARWAIEHAADHARDHGPGCNSTRGSSKSGHIIAISEDESCTHEGYIQALDRYLAATRK